MNAFWASENFDAFIVFRSFQLWRGKPTQKRSSLLGADHNHTQFSILKGGTFFSYTIFAAMP
jgi:hypothetical protein